MTSTIQPAPDLELQQPGADTSWKSEISATLRLAWPLIISQLAQIALFTTDAIMMGWLGPTFLGAGTLTTTFMHSFLLFGVGILSAVAPLVAQAKGAGDEADIRRFMRQGFWVTLCVAGIMVPILWNIRPLFDLLGQAPEVSRLAETYAHTAVWMFFPGLGFIVLRALLATHDDTKIILVITVAGIAVNAASNWALMFGHWGFPRLELAGAGISTSLVNTLMFLATLGYILSRKAYRHYALFVRFWKPDWQRFFRILRIGLPIGFMMLAEVGLFSVAGIYMGWIGTDTLAAHAVALQMAAISFMVPLGLSHASTVRVGLARGRNSKDAVRKAGWVSIGLGTGFMSLTAILFFAIPETLVSLFLDPALPKNETAFALAVSFLGIAAMFQLVDGAQVVSAAVLRGLNDTTVPMVLGLFGYWGVGLVLAYCLAFPAGLAGFGVWIGMAAALAAVAVVMTARFAMRERFGLF